MPTIPHLFDSAGWDSLPSLLNHEFEQSAQEGRDPKALDQLRQGMDQMDAQQLVDLHAHTNNNAAVCAAALLVSQGDFHQGITFAVMGGWDTDCNGATVGSIVGILQGAQKVPSHWSSRLNDTLRSQIPDYHPIAISECARRSVKIAQP